jgi:group I intron endonuclease
VAIVYFIMNWINGKGYVGWTVKTVDQRWSEHRGGYGSAERLRRAIKKYGFQNFFVQEIESGLTAEQAKQMEKWWIARLATFGQGYNQTAGGDGSIGRVWTPEQRKQISDKKRGIPLGRPQWNTGKRLSAAHCQKLSDFLLEHQGNLGSERSSPLSPILSAVLRCGVFQDQRIWKHD